MEAKKNLMDAEEETEFQELMKFLNKSKKEEGMKTIYEPEELTPDNIKKGDYLVCEDSGLNTLLPIIKIDRKSISAKERDLSVKVSYEEAIVITKDERILVGKSASDSAMKNLEDIEY